MTTYKVRIFVKGTDLEILITSSDPENALLMAAAIIDRLRLNDMEPTIEIQVNDKEPVLRI